MLVTIFCEMDDFCKDLAKKIDIPLLATSSKRGRKENLTWSEVLTIVVYYHYSGYKAFKHYYNYHVKVALKNDFKSLVSYNRFVELMQQAALPLMLYFQLKATGKCTGVSIIDSTALKVCMIKREYSQRLIFYFQEHDEKIFFYLNQNLIRHGYYVSYSLL